MALVDTTRIYVYSIHMKSRDVIKRLHEDGWHHVKTTGDHWHFKHPTKPGKVTVPHPKKDLSRLVMKSIEKQAGIKLK